MEKLIRKIKNLGIFLFVVNILSLTWFFIDYLALKKIWAETNQSHDFEWLMVILSSIPFALLIIIAFIFLFYVLRLNMKYKSEKKKENEKTEKQDNA
jgi:uncharacterized BrkB/YihY/UPF0761 family membrane protein